MRVPFKAGGLQYQNLKAEIDATLTRVLEEGQYSLNKDVTAFEQAFATYCSARYGVGVGSGTDAIVIALLCLGVGAGDEVITADNGCASVPVAIVRVGATPVYVDIDADTYNINVEQMEKAITPRTKALLSVHSYGQPCDMKGVMEIAARHGLKVIEDASLAAGARYEGRPVGNFGDVGVFSLGAGKVLNSYGSAGILVTDDAALADLARTLREYGSRAIQPEDGINPDYTAGGRVSGMAGFNTRLEALQASILGVKLPKLDQWIEERVRIAKIYDQQLADLEVVTPYIAPNAVSAYRGYIIRVQNRDQVMAALRERGVEVSTYYIPPLHLQPLWKGLGYQEGDFPVTELIARELLVLPLYPELTDEQVFEVVDALRSCVPVKVPA